MPTDIALPAVVRAPTRADFEQGYVENRASLLAIARSLVGQDAEDVVQDVYVIGRTQLGQVRDAMSLGPWLTRVLVNECYRLHRRGRTLDMLMPKVGRAASPPSDPDLRALVERLPLRDRALVVLHYGHGLSLEEIARILDKKPATLRSQLFRARRWLRENLSEGSDNPDRRGSQ